MPSAASSATAPVALTGLLLLTTTTTLLCCPSANAQQQQVPPPAVANFLAGSPLLQQRRQPPTGQIADDARCDVEQLEQANDSQLHTILRELVGTAFFRTFAVDLDHHCPLAGLGSGSGGGGRGSGGDDGGGDTESKMKQPQTQQTQSSSEDDPFGTDERSGANDDDDDEPQCAGGLPDLDPDAEPACSVQGSDDPLGLGLGGLGGDADNDGGMSLGASDSAGTSFGGGQSDSGNADDTIPMTKDTSNADDDKTEPTTTLEDEEFGCPSAKSDEFGLDDDAEPLCTVAPASSSDVDPEETGGGGGVISSVLNSLKEKVGGWESQSERDTFQWTRPSDPVVLDGGVEDDLGKPCDDQTSEGGGGDLPDLFWVDMCSNIKAGEGLQVVNLALNPERNTGYNGTHIWNAIYEENCLAVSQGAASSGEMCYEERVLYRLLSGMHTSTTLSIAKNYYPPSKRKGRTSYEANPQYFMDKFGDNPEHIRNLHFSYVVLLRALRKASPFLHRYEIRTGNIVEDETATVLLRRLLDSAILQSCHDVFTAFDESLMFREDGAERLQLQHNFKGVFHNISSILDCVQCQQCKLHGKMTMMGYGTALKVLFLPREDLIPSALSRNEIVAFINTIAGMSESIKEVRELTAMYWAGQIRSNARSGLPMPDDNGAVMGSSELVDAAVGAASELAKAGRISTEREAELVSLAFSKDSNLMILAKHYGADLDKFLLHSQNVGNLAGDGGEPDAIVIGSGLAGLSATLNLLDRGGKVIVVEKEHRLGGNSNKASSGINACCPTNGTHDFIEAFRNDTTRSAGDSARLPLINTLVENSGGAVEWLKDRVGVDLSLVAQLGGHVFKRTHRPKNGMVGAEIIYGVQKAIKEYEKSGMVEIMVDTSVQKLIQDEDGRVIGVEVKHLKEDDNDNTSPTRLMAPNVVLATGGFASDRRGSSYLAKYRPELLGFPATAGDFSTGDGVTLATALGAGIVDMEKVQIHPTGWVDPKDPSNPSKILAGELMRGVGGILINSEGERFCDELGTRAYVTDKMLSHDPFYAKSKKWEESNDNLPTFSLVISSSAAEDGKKHVDHYTHKGLLTRLDGVSALATWMAVDEEQVRSTLQQYQQDAEAGADSWGKTSFRGVPQKDLDKEVFYAGTVTPVLHYCMGGITINNEGSVLDQNGTAIPGLHAAGEVSGGVHGNNRLGGNSLLECTVYGTIVGKKLPIKPRATTVSIGSGSAKAGSDEHQTRDVTRAELSEHSSKEDCWIAIDGKVYDLTDFAEEHPAGPASIHELGGQDGTVEFLAIHSIGIMEDFDDVLIGPLVVD